MVLARARRPPGRRSWSAAGPTAGSRRWMTSIADPDAASTAWPPDTVDELGGVDVLVNDASIPSATLTALDIGTVEAVTAHERLRVRRYGSPCCVLVTFLPPSPARRDVRADRVKQDLGRRSRGSWIGDRSHQLSISIGCSMR